MSSVWFSNDPPPGNYIATTITSTTSGTGWWSQPQTPLWAPQIGSPQPLNPNAPPLFVPWLQPAPLAPVQPEPMLDDAVKKQIEDAKLSPHAALVGYRGWLVDLFDEEGPKLKSLVSRVVWPYRQELRAHKLCAAPYGYWTHPNGIHAARDAGHLHRQGYQSTAKVTGEVYLWGRIIHGEVGYRAEMAYPKLLQAQRNYWWLKDLAGRYGIPYEVA